MADWFNMPSNFSNGTKAVEGVGTLFQYGNEITNNSLGGVIVGLIFLISFLVLGANKSAMAAALFMASIFSILLARLEMVNPIVPIGFIIALVVSVIVLSKSRTN